MIKNISNNKIIIKIRTVILYFNAPFFLSILTLLKQSLKAHKRNDVIISFMEVKKLPIKHNYYEVAGCTWVPTISTGILNDAAASPALVSASSPFVGVVVSYNHLQ